VALINSPQSPFELAIASEVFGILRPDLPVDYEFSVCSAVPGLVDTLGGYPILVERGLEHLEQADTIIIPGWEPTGAVVPATILHALVAAHERGVRLLSICTGAFVLAQTGLLDGRRATTHWRHIDALAAQFPRVQAEDDVLFVDHGDVATSAGTAAGLDLCLHVVRSDHGADRAARVARHMVMPPRREGDQRQYAVRPAPEASSGSLAELLDWAGENLGAEVTLGVLADRAHLSPRTLDRRFREQLGVSPGKWLLGRRVDAARVLLETTDLTIDAIAMRVGLSSATNLRRRFHNGVGTAPNAYRRAFAVAPPLPPAAPSQAASSRAVPGRR
jgi:AraC family transcriptional activator FtrA